MELTPQIFRAQVMHKRLLPKVNAFRYKVYYLALPLAQRHDYQDGWRFRTQGPAVLSYYDEDHGARDINAPLERWWQQILQDYGLEQVVAHTQLIALPRVFGYVFNPVSFWLGFDEQKQLRAVLCEVNNTFGQTHSYLCAHADHRPITAEDWLTGEKLFHVSPFLPREGRYRFRFAVQEKNSLGIWIDYDNAEGRTQLLTALTGTLEPLNRANLRRAFRAHPLVTFKTIFLIHWQAFKLISKGIRYVPLPKQLKQRLSGTDGLSDKQ